ncbi:hypothetical protein OIU83_13720 [Flavobacterium sp. LS1R49]|uniref:Lipocalin-like domain-containing protein n=1 Tax=Flavobacterium shii TaxID=2987687 RepID=A0A9X3C7K1_9FLAO|nr:hypothetical protein [Flavobacterium shii]MCV9928723.1 hypothetical protein [Flavobacterium shii]
MRKSTLFIFGLALLSVLMISCHKGRNKLINSWKVTNVEATGKPLSDSLKNVILTKGNLTFTKDGKVTGYLDVDFKGTFALSKGGKDLVLKDEVGTPYSYASTIENDKLILDGKEIKLTFDKK